jgi:NAD(P) transhydrogenase subunit alpha
VAIEPGAGLASAVTDAMYEQAGAKVSADALSDADVVLRVRHPQATEITAMKKGAVLVGMLSPYQEKDLLAQYAARGITAFAMELVPRITRAQSMDVLSSQANLAGYKAVIDAAEQFGRAFPMMMTAPAPWRPPRSW